MHITYPNTENSSIYESQCMINCSGGMRGIRVARESFHVAHDTKTSPLKANGMRGPHRSSCQFKIQMQWFQLFTQALGFLPVFSVFHKEYRRHF